MITASATVLADCLAPWSGRIGPGRTDAATAVGPSGLEVSCIATLWRVADRVPAPVRHAAAVCPACWHDSLAGSAYATPRDAAAGSWNHCRRVGVPGFKLVSEPDVGAGDAATAPISAAGPESSGLSERPCSVLPKK